MKTNESQSTASMTEARFKQYHKDNPLVYEYFKTFALQRAQKGQKFSARAVIHRIRWEVSVTTTDKTSSFKINDHYSSHYARLFIQDYPQHKDKINIRQSN